MRCIGLMTGTSCDAVDTILVDFSREPSGEVICFESLPIPEHLRLQLIALTRPSPNEINNMLLAEQAITDCYIQSVHALLDKAGLASNQIDLIGCHGQTIRHQMIEGKQLTLQLVDSAKLAAQTHIPVVSNFRRRDIAEGGEGAPLMPLFHQAIWPKEGHFAVLNLGGIANVTVFKEGCLQLAYDIGPANGLMDAWVQKHWQLSYDDQGLLAQSGQVHHALLQQCLKAPYFSAKAPKSTGRDVFHLDWLSATFPDLDKLKPEDVLATLSALTVHTVSDAICEHLVEGSTVFVAGGGANNTFLLACMAQHCAHYNWTTRLPGQIDPQWLEAYGFAWLAWHHVLGTRHDTAQITGATSASVLGCLYPH